MKTKLFILSIGLLVLLTILLFPQQEVVMHIKEGMPAIPLALPKFIVHDKTQALEEAAQTMHRVISADLKYSRVFNTLPESYYGYISSLDPKNIVFKDWESIQAQMLFVGEVSLTRSQTFLFEGKLYDVKAGRFIFGKRYQGEASLLRTIAHRMSDEVMKIMGERPIFTTKIVFTSNRSGNDEIYIMDYDGFNQTRLTFNKVKDYMPAWSADGKKIAYTSYRGTQAGLYILNPFEGTISEIENRGTNFAPAFSPDGRKLAFCSTLEEGNSEIYVANSNGKNIKRLTFNKGADVAPSWSPTSREIAFTSDRGGTPQIYIMDAEGTNVRRVSFGGTYHDAPAWAPTGDRIAYVSRVDQIFDLYILNLRTHQIVKQTESFARNESPCWSPDGRHLLFTSNRTGRIQIYSIDYDGQNLRRLTNEGDNKLPNWSRR
jgi:TolB protein